MDRDSYLDALIEKLSSDSFRESITKKVVEACQKSFEEAKKEREAAWDLAFQPIHDNLARMKEEWDEYLAENKRQEALEKEEEEKKLNQESTYLGDKDSRKFHDEIKKVESTRHGNLENYCDISMGRAPDLDEEIEIQDGCNVEKNEDNLEGMVNDLTKEMKELRKDWVEYKEQETLLLAKHESEDDEKKSKNKTRTGLLKKTVFQNLQWSKVPVLEKFERKKLRKEFISMKKLIQRRRRISSPLKKRKNGQMRNHQKIQLWARKRKFIRRVRKRKKRRKFKIMKDQEHQITAATFDQPPPPSAPPPVTEFYLLFPFIFVILL